MTEMDRTRGVVQRLVGNKNTHTDGYNDRMFCPLDKEKAPGQSEETEKSTWTI